MKISYMIKRENFYDICKKTLDKVFLDKNNRTKLFVYPNLNAIITRNADKKVKEFLFTEYSINGSIAKKTAVLAYLHLCLDTFGVSASKTIFINDKKRNDLLIYPCNRKLRFFYFNDNVVKVAIKDGFPNNDLLHEIEFRKSEDLPSFVPKILSFDGTGYTETIIDGVPLARINAGFENYQKEAFDLLDTFRNPTKRTVSGSEYAKKLLDEAKMLCTPKISGINLDKTIEKLYKAVADIPDIELCFSHGDLQSGNIWVENNTNKIYIIDWESWGERSSFYDKAVLFDRLRPDALSDYIKKNIDDGEKSVVLFEDLVYRLNEVNNLPFDYGIGEFKEYVEQLQAF